MSIHEFESTFSWNEQKTQIVKSHMLKCRFTSMLSVIIFFLSVYCYAEFDCCIYLTDWITRRLKHTFYISARSFAPTPRFRAPLTVCELILFCLVIIFMMAWCYWDSFFIQLVLSIAIDFLYAVQDWWTTLSFFSVIILWYLWVIHIGLEVLTPENTHRHRSLYTHTHTHAFRYPSFSQPPVKPRHFRKHIGE